MRWWFERAQERFSSDDDYDDDDIHDGDDDNNDDDGGDDDYDAYNGDDDDDGVRSRTENKAWGASGSMQLRNGVSWENSIIQLYLYFSRDIINILNIFGLQMHWRIKAGILIYFCYCEINVK